MSTDSVEPVLSASSDKHSRNPVERVIVWGLISGLLVVAGIEARAQRGYTMSLNAFQTAFADGEEIEISLDEARQLMMLGPAEVKTPKEPGPYHYYDYYRFSWFSLFKDGDYEIILKVTSNKDLTVISFSTPAAPLPEWMQQEIPQPGDAESEDSSNDESGFAGDGGNRFGGRGFQPPPNPLVTKLDINGDNELSAEEIEGSPAVLESLDANGDGELTDEEFDPEGFGRRGRGSEQGSLPSSEGSESDSGSSRPQRPVLEE